jgi:CubicO group peptidase (beta-lactamase class C family)
MPRSSQIREDHMTRNRTAAFALALLLLIGSLAHAADSLPTTKPEKVGLSAERLARIDRLMEGYVESDRLPGALGMIARQGKVAYLRTWGMRDRETGTPMTPDTIFRIYSMSKPITSVAVMILFEEGHFRLKDPIGRFIPELADLEVMQESKDPETGGTTVTTFKSKRQITIQDLLRHTAGLTYGIFGNTTVDRMYREAEIMRRDETLAEMVARLGELPLLYEPGTTWHYSVADDVLGRLVEVVSGMPFDEFLEKRLFGPLGMTDSGFWVPPAKQGRFAQLYSPDGTEYNEEAFLRRAGDPHVVVPSDPRASERYLSKPKFFSGGGGMVSTASDYMRFCLMMLNGGELDGTRILSRKTVELITADHLSGLAMPTPRPGYTFGLGFAVAEDRGIIAALGSEGEYNWGGAAGTRFWIDPREQLVGVFMVQIIPHLKLRYGEEFRHLSYQAIAD